jgi:glutamate-1-semialdehyde 2,1-aminomutase
MIKIIAIVQARMGSTRLPGKVLRQVRGVPLIQTLLERLSRSKKIQQVTLATSIEPANDLLERTVQNLGFPVFRGSERDVLSRFYLAAEPHQPNWVVRITGDCPFIDPELVDHVIEDCLQRELEYCTTAEGCFPDGLDTEVFSFRALKMAYENATEPYDREHVTPYLKKNANITKGEFKVADQLGHLRWTVDEPEDLEVVSKVLSHFYPRNDFSWREVLQLSQDKPECFQANQKIGRNEGATLGTGQKLWKRAKRVIPGGNMLLSKRPEMFLPEQWPAYFSKAKGCQVWDLDGNCYTDMSIMGIGTNTLGYGNPEVDEAVRKTVDSGNMSTFNCPEEVLLAEKLVELHPWADMVRLARSGGEANAIATRIARAASGRDAVAICGYHGWHDWYLAANLGDEKGLDGHLLPGLEPKGVPRALRGTVHPFEYNRFDQLEALVRNHSIGVIQMEVSRNFGPEDHFLEKVRKLATDKGIVLVFDECTSGFRQTFGGLHKLFGVEPDMAMFGKALGNGYAITAVIGRREVMEAAQTSFISSTFWTERIGPTAALATLKVMERERSWERITDTGLTVKKLWGQLADRHGIKINQWGLPALAGFTIQSEHSLAYKTLITQEMLGKGYLASNSLYACLEHTPEVLTRYEMELDRVFKMISECESGRDVSQLLQGPVCHGGFKRLN